MSTETTSAASVGLVVRDAARGIDLALTLAPGETVALAGPNGAGKSTVLQTLAGLFVPDEGRVSIDGRALTEVVDGRGSVVPSHRRGVGLLHQDARLFPHLTARENVAFGPRSAGMRAGEARALADDLLARVDAGGLGDRRPAALSGGQAQRVALARALATSPRLLLLDEPMAALDVVVVPGLRRTIAAALAGTTALVVTHDAADIRALAGRLVVIEDGRIVADGPPEEVLASGATAFLRTLAETVTSGIPLPPFDNSQMDGYAVRSADTADARADAPFALRLAPHIPAGAVGAELLPGTAAPIMTGAAIPTGADAVVPIEECDPPRFLPDGADGVVRLAAPVAAARFVRSAGSDLPKGAVLLEAGRALGPAQRGVLAAAGIAAVSVFEAPHVLLLSTGSELVPAGRPLVPGSIHDANGPALAALLAGAGARVTAVSVRDDPAELASALADVPDGIRLVVSMGGVSEGAYEVIRGTLEPTGTWFGHVAMQPGGPQGLGSVTVGRGADARVVPLVALPGNPVSSLVSAELFLRQPIAQASGVRPAARGRGTAPLAEALTSPPGVLQVRRGRMREDGSVEPVGGPSSHLLRHYAESDLLLHVPVGVGSLDAGDPIEYWSIA